MPYHHSKDFVVLYDEEEADEGSTTLRMVKLVTGELEEEGYSGSYATRDASPGQNRWQFAAGQMLTSQFILCLITINSHSMSVSDMLKQQIGFAFRNRAGKQTNQWIIPMFYNMSSEDVGSLLQPGSDLAELSLLQHLHIQENDDSWTTKLRGTLQVLPSISSLIRVYKRILPEVCSPIHRLVPLLQNVSRWIDIFLKPQFRAADFKDNKEVRGSHLKKQKDIDKLINQLVVGSRLTIWGAGGMGKSTLSCHIARMWCASSELQEKFSLMLLLPLRLIKNHTGPTESVLCQSHPRVYSLFPAESEGEVRRVIKHNPSKILWVLDGYDEVSDMVKDTSIITDIISGDIAGGSTVIVTTRPHCRDELNQLTHGTYNDVSLIGMADESVDEYIRQVIAASGIEEEEYVILTKVKSFLPPALMRVPLLLTFSCLMWQWQLTNGCEEGTEVTNLPQLLGRVLGMFLSIHEEKVVTGKLRVYQTPLDKSVPKGVARTFRDISKLCFHTFSSQQLVFTPEVLKEYSLDDDVVLERFGFFDVTVDADGSVSAQCIHSLIQEYCAAVHVAENKQAMQIVLDRVKGQNGALAKLLDRYTNILLFAVSLNPFILEALANTDFSITTGPDEWQLEDGSTPNLSDLDLTYESQLVQACTVKEVKDMFAKSMLKRSILACGDLFFHWSPASQVSPAGYMSVVQELGSQGCLHLLKMCHGDHLQVCSDWERCMMSDRETLVITDTLLLSCLPLIQLTDTDVLLIEHATLAPLMYTTQHWKKHELLNRVQKVVFGNVTCSSVEVAALLQLVTPADGCRELVLEGDCKLMGGSRQRDDDNRINVHELNVAAVPVSGLKELLQYFHVDRFIYDLHRTDRNGDLSESDLLAMGMATDHTVKEVKLSSLASCQVDALVRGLHAMAPDSGMENVSLGYDCNLHQLNPLPTDIPSLKVNRLDIFETVLHLDVLMTLVKHLTVTTLELGSPYEYKKPLKLDPVTYNAEEKPIKVTSVTSMTLRDIQDCHNLLDTLWEGVKVVHIDSWHQVQDDHLTHNQLRKVFPAAEIIYKVPDLKK